MKYKFLEHTADAKFQSFGKTLEQAFENAALALTSIMIDPEKVSPKIEKNIEIQGNDQKSLLYNFLEELLFLLDTDFFILNKIKGIKIEKTDDGYKLIALLVGDTIDDNYEITGEVKAITYNDMEIKQEKNNFTLQLVVDL